MTQNMHSQPPVASQHKKTNKVVWTYEDNWPPKRTSTYKRPFTQEGNYLVVFASKSLCSVEQWYSNIERASLWIMHGLENLHHYFFAHKVHFSKDHTQLIGIIGKDVLILSQCLQCIILHIHQYRAHILYKPDPKLFIADWLSWYSHEENKDQEIWGPSMNVKTLETAVNLLVFTSIYNI